MGKTGEPVAIKTKFRWVLNGPLNEKFHQDHVTVVNETKTHNLNLCFEPTKTSDPTKIESLETDLKKLWHLEILSTVQNENSMHDHFIKSFHLNNERRYRTNLPFQENHLILYDHFDLDKNQLEQLFKKLKNDKGLDFPKLKRLRFARVVFSVTSSPFLLNGTIGNNEYDEEFVEKIFM